MNTQILSRITLFYVLVFFLGSISSLKAQSLSGYYTIGASPSNYSTIGAATSDLKSKGVSGPTVFMIKAGSYSELLQVDSISGTSKTNTITFTTDTAATTKAQITRNGLVCFLSHTNHLRITNLIFRTTASTNVMQITGMTKDLKVIGNEFYGYTGLGNNRRRATIYETGDSYSDGQDLWFENNIIRYGDFGFYADGWAFIPRQKNLTLLNNKIDSFSHRGVDIQHWDSVRISGNEIRNSNWYNTVAMNLYFISNFEVDRNIIESVDSTIGRGIYFDWCNTRPNMKGIVHNNCIDVDGPQSNGVYVDLCDSIEFSYNTIRSEGKDTIRCSVFRSYNSEGISLYNNNLTALGGGYCLITNKASSPYASNHNNWYTTSGSFANTNRGKFTTFSAWKNAWGTDSLSINENPQFLVTNRKLPTNAALSDTAVVLQGINHDLNGTPRGLRPDIGCIEFVTSKNNGAVVNTNSIYCNGRDTLKIEVVNTGGNDITMLSLNWSIFNKVTNVLVSQGISKFTGLISAGDSTRISLSSFLLKSNDTLNALIILDSVNHKLDEEPFNDTLRIAEIYSQSTKVSLTPLNLICSNTPNVLLSNGVPSGGNYFGNAIDSVFIIVDSTNVGANSLFYTYTDHNNCVDTASLSYIVNAAPLLQKVGTNEYCLNDQADTLKNILPVGGTYSGLGIQNNVFTPSIQTKGKHTHKYTYADSNGCLDSISDYTIVNANPALTIGSTPRFCADGQLKILNSVYPLGGTYSGLQVVSDSLFSTVGIRSGVFSISYNYTDTNNCNSDTVIQVTIDSLTELSVLPNLSFCKEKSDTTLSFGQPHGGKYIGTFITQDSIFMLSTSIPNTYNVLYAFENKLGCVSIIDTQITVLKLPEFSLGKDTTLCSNKKLTLNPGITLSTYEWSNGNKTKDLIVSQLGNYWLFGEDNNGCGFSDTIKVNFELCNTSINQVNDKPIAVKVYPNPAVNKFTIQLGAGYSNSIIKVSIYTIAGALVQESQIQKEVNQVDVSSLESGQYIFQLTTGSSIEVGRLIIRD